MRRLAPVLLVVFALVPSASSATPDRPGFRLADDSVRCELVSADRVVCTSAGAGSLLMSDTGAPVSVRRAAAAMSLVLQPGSRWARGGVSCTVVDAEVRCTNRGGALLAIGGTSVAVVGPGAAAVSG